MAEYGFSAHEKKSTKSLRQCFLVLEVGYWQASQPLNWVSSGYMVVSFFGGDYHESYLKVVKYTYCDKVKANS